jgi:hypothetical protein
MEAQEYTEYEVDLNLLMVEHCGERMDVDAVGIELGVW